LLHSITICNKTNHNQLKTYILYTLLSKNFL
jgi:hypothetical protein